MSHQEQAQDPPCALLCPRSHSACAVWSPSSHGPAQAPPDDCLSCGCPSVSVSCLHGPHSGASENRGHREEGTHPSFILDLTMHNKPGAQSSEVQMDALPSQGVT